MLTSYCVRLGNGAKISHTNGILPSRAYLPVLWYSFFCFFPESGGGVFPGGMHFRQTAIQICIYIKPTFMNVATLHVNGSKTLMGFVMKNQVACLKIYCSHGR